jgi:hypothetical protein
LRRRSITTAAAACLITGWGGGAAPRPASAPAGGPPRFIAAGDLERERGNDFRRGLYRLAVMSQPPEDATDLGQSLPTGLLHDVACAARGERPTGPSAWSWRCIVRWETVGGARRNTRYAVRLLPTGCFAAAADPELPERLDTTIATYAEHPLNALVSVRRGC